MGSRTARAGERTDDLSALFDEVRVLFAERLDFLVGEVGLMQVVNSCQRVPYSDAEVIGEPFAL